MTQTVTTAETVVELRGLTKHFTDSRGVRIAAVDGVDLTIRRGEVVAFLGPNGAGKTTTIDLLLGLTKPDAGHVSLFGTAALAAVQAGRVSVVMQTGGLLPDMTVEDTVRMMGTLYTGADPERCLQRAGLSRLGSRRVSTCSGGEQQRLRFALALLPEPELLVLDEPTAGMDVEARHEFWAAVREDAQQGLTVLFATHYLEEADQFADRIVLLDRGTVAADGSVAAIRATVHGRTVSAVVPVDEALALTRTPGTTILETRGNRTFFDSPDSDGLLRQLLGDTRATQIEVTPRSLEEAFLTITREHHSPNA